MKNSILIALTLLATVTAFGQENKDNSKTNKFDLFVKTSQGQVLIDKNDIIQDEITAKIYSTYENEMVNLDETVVIKTDNATLTGKYVMEKKDKYLFLSFVYDQKETNSNTRVAATE